MSLKVMQSLGIEQSLYLRKLLRHFGYVKSLIIKIFIFIFNNDSVHFSQNDFIKQLTKINTICKINSISTQCLKNSQVPGL